MEGEFRQQGRGNKEAKKKPEHNNGPRRPQGSNGHVNGHGDNGAQHKKAHQKQGQDGQKQGQDGQKKTAKPKAPRPAAKTVSSVLME